MTTLVNCIESFSRFKKKKKSWPNFLRTHVWFTRGTRNVTVTRRLRFIYLFHFVSFRFFFFSILLSEGTSRVSFQSLSITILSNISSCLRTPVVWRCPPKRAYFGGQGSGVEKPKSKLCRKKKKNCCHLRGLVTRTRTRCASTPPVKFERPNRQRDIGYLWNY